MQHKYIAKLISYDFEITYKQGKENTVVDALSRLPTTELVVLVVSSPVGSLMPKVEESWQNDPQLQKVISELQAGREVDGGYYWEGQLLKKKGRLVVGNSTELRQKLIGLFHNTALRGHSGNQATYKRLQLVFHWKVLDKDVRNFVRNCSTCQICKYDTSKPSGLL